MQSLPRWPKCTKWRKLVGEDTLFPLLFELKPGASSPVRRAGVGRAPPTRTTPASCVRCPVSLRAAPLSFRRGLAAVAELTCPAGATRAMGRRPSAPSSTSSPRGSAPAVEALARPPCLSLPGRASRRRRRLGRKVGRERAGRVLGFHLCSQLPQYSSDGRGGDGE